MANSSTNSSSPSLPISRAIALFSVLGISAIAANPVRAASFNPDFTNPAWQTSIGIGGDVLVNSSTQVSLSNSSTSDSLIQDDPPNPEGTFNYSGFSPLIAVSPSDLEDFVGLPAGGLDLDALNQAFEGSAIKQEFDDIVGGNTLSFNLVFPRLDPNDYGFVVLNGAIIGTFTSNTNFTTGPIGIGGINTIAIGVVDIGDSSNTTQLQIFAPVPFEFSPAIGLMGLSTIFGVIQLKRSLKK
jgi:hypothetical protein